MAKYCDRCGKPLPEGVELCPDCMGGAPEDEAALFTRMTTETQVWRKAEPVKQNRILDVLRSNRSRVFLYSGALLLAALAVLLILLTQPGVRAVRMLDRGEVEKAYAFFCINPRLASAETRNSRLDEALLAAGQRLCDQYAAHELDADTAAGLLAKLGGFGPGAAELMEPTYARFRGYNGSQIRMDEAERFFADGDFLAAREAYLLVDENDASFADAREKAETCLLRYGETVGDAAEALMAENRFPEALAALRAGNDALKELGTFSEIIDKKMPECFDRYEAYALAEAKALADAEDYTGAVEKLRSVLPDFDSAPKSFSAAEEEYIRLDRKKEITDAGAQADALYAEGSFDEAFAVLDALRAETDETKTMLAELLETTENRFAAEFSDKAKALAVDREGYPEAIDVLDKALRIRELEALKSLRDDLAQYLPLSLADAEYSSKEGTVFRSDSAFESLDGTVFQEGWIWGENGAKITFALDGAYDELTCAFAVRRKDNANANGRFEVWCDGEKLLRSDKLFHYQEEPQYHTLDISGCKELTIVFECDYKASTAENGYCYHGLCDIQVTKDLPEQSTEE